MPWSATTVVACDALSALFDPLHALFAGLRQGHPHLLDDVCEQRFSIALSSQGVPTIALTTDPLIGHAPRVDRLAYDSALRAAGMGGHAATRLVALLSHATEALRRAAPCAGMPAAALPIAATRDGGVFCEEAKVWHTEGHHKAIAFHHGALHTTLPSPDSPYTDTAWRLALLACLASPGRSYLYLSDAHMSTTPRDRIQVRADSAEDAALLVAARLQGPQAAAAFLAKGATFWTHPVTTAPAGPMPWDIPS